MIFKIKLNVLLTLFCFFPFIGLNFGIDTQPFALLLSIIVLLLQCKEKRKLLNPYGEFLLFLIIIIFVLTIISLLFNSPFPVFKRLFSYMSIILIPLATCNSLKSLKKGKIEHLIKICILIWFFVGFIQSYVNSNFLKFLIPLYRTSVTRGVCSLSSEPSFYGYMCFLMFLFCLEFKTNRIFYILLTVIQVLFFAQSTVSIIYFIIFAIMYVFFTLLKMKRKNVLKILTICIAFIFSFYLLNKYFTGSRMVNLINQILTNPIDLLNSDESVMQRLNSILLSFQNFGMPSILGEFTIMSGFGGAFLELGFFSFLLFIPLIKSIYLSYENEYKYIVPITIIICMFSAIQLSSPLFSFYIGYRYIITRQERILKNEYI